MPNDALTVTAIINELKPLILGGKINKIMQPQKEELHILIYNNGKLLKLLISANPSSSRLHLTNYSKENPLAAPQFCMLLRKHLTGGEIVNIQCTPYDRIVSLTIANFTELKDKTYKKLHVEILGRQSNIIFCEQDETIIAPLKTVSFDMTSKRAVMAGLKYVPVDSGNKFAISDKERFIAYLKDYQGGNLTSYITACVMGFSKATAEHLLKTATSGKMPSLPLNENQINAIAVAFYDFDTKINNLNLDPCIALNSGEFIDFYALPYFGTQNFDIVRFDSINNCIDEFYLKKDTFTLLKERAKLASSVIKNTKSKMTKKIAHLSEKLAECENMDIYKKYGELLTCFLYKIKPKTKEIGVEDFYDDNQLITIPLQENLNPSQNAQRYFKLYNKLKTAKTMSEIQLNEANELLTYISSVEGFLAESQAIEEIDEINEELIKAGLLKKQNTKGKKIKEYKPNISQTEVDGHKIMYGKNNLQNDYLTFKIAKPDDVWLHAKGYHGSHVIVSAINKTVSENALYQAAKIAALNSSGKSSDKVAVDFTPKKFVKKPNGSKPGFVVYNEYKSLIVNLKD